MTGNERKESKELGGNGIKEAGVGGLDKGSRVVNVAKEMERRKKQWRKVRVVGRMEEEGE